MDEPLVSAIRERLRLVEEQAAEAARRAGRDPRQVRLVVVSKSQPLEVVRAALAAGVDILGENYAEEAEGKIRALGTQSAVEWHMVGHVQSRKAGLVALYFSMLHSLDRLKLAARLDASLAELGRELPVLLEMNVSGEATKSGWTAWEDAHLPQMLTEVEKALSMPRLKVQGLMTMPPYSEDQEQARPFFRRLRRLQEILRNRFPHLAWDELSMGTSADYQAAVEEGATYIRVGQAILGPRPSRQV